MRNIQLDFFRGVALLIIFINHIPFNDFFYYTPSRFGLSDAAEIFVFLSGFAAAIAFGRSFAASGLWLGSVRVLYRCVQIYLAHLALFFLLASVCSLANAWLSGPDYIQRLYIQFFFDRTQEALLGLVTLGYVPNYFDILPMYLVVMLWVPVVWALSRIHVVVAIGFSLGLYLAMWLFGLELPADPLSERPWYFNPFAWQLIFFTGFAFGSGWIKTPPYRTCLTAISLTIVVLCIPLGHEPTYQHFAFWGKLRGHLEPWLDKSHLGPMRWVHFMALAYLMNQLMNAKPHWLQYRVSQLVTKMGQQALPMFMYSMTLSYVAGMALDHFERNLTSLLAVNLGGVLLMLVTAPAMAWLFSKPWKTLGRANRDAEASGSLPLPFPAAWVKQGSLAMLIMLLALAPLSLLRPTTKPETVATIAPIGSTPVDENPLIEDVSMDPQYGDRI